MKVNVSKKFMDKLENGETTYKIQKKTPYKKISKFILRLELFILFVVLPIFAVESFKDSYEYIIEDNQVVYAEQIEENNNYINNYADEIQKHELSDLEIIMKVMFDIWDEIEGYGQAEDLPLGYCRLAFQEEDRGVCTSFADDFTTRMNAINSEYNARNIIVFCDNNETKGLQICDIEQKIVEEPVTDDSPFSELETKLITNLIGNHMVSLIDIPNTNLTLMVDTTNLLIGVFKNGKIHVLNNNNDKLLDYKFISNYVCSENSFYGYCSDYFHDFGNPDQTIDELNTLYGYEEQKEALEYVKKIENK